MHKYDEIRTVEIIDMRLEGEEITTLWFKDELTSEASPGQYLMIWYPGIDEVPMSISTINDKGKSSISVRDVGETTKAIVALNIGDRIGVRGPYGNGYELRGLKPLIVAGGSGAASLLPLVRIMVQEGIKPTFVLGARNAEQLLFEKQLNEILNSKLIISTDDGSKGYHGFASDYAARLLEKNDYDSIYTCGPELMMLKVYHDSIKHNIPIQASLERYIKCAVGLCGACLIGSYRVCKDGPVFNKEMLDDIKNDFGVNRISPSGKKIRVDH